MPRYEIELSNGAVYEVDGPDNASEEQLMGALAGNLDPVDLSVLRSKNDAFGEFLRTRVQEPIAGESPTERSRRLFGEIPKPAVGVGEGALRAGVQGAAFGYGDELVGAGAAALSSATGSDQALGDLYDVYTARERDKIESFRASNPALAIGSEIAGAVPTAVLTGGGSTASTLGGRALAGAGTGAAQGSVYGFGAGEGGLANRAGNAAITGAVGGTIGAAAPAVAAGARNLYNATLGSGRAARQAGLSRPAYDFLSDVVDADRPGLPLGKDALLAERGPTAASALDFLAQRPGPSQKVIQDAVQARVAGAGNRVAGALDETLGAVQGVRETGRQISRTTAPARQAAYDRAYDAVIDYAGESGRKIEGVLRRVPNRTMRQAVRTANEAMQADGVLNRQIVATAKPDGALSFSVKPNVQQLDYIKRALGEIGAGEVDSFGRPTGAGIRSNNLARDLRNALGKAVPEYNEAVRLGGDKIARDNGLRLGARLLSARTSREEVREFARGFGKDMPEDVLEAVRTGVRANIDDTMANVRRTMADPNTDAREAAKAIKDLSSRANREKLTEVLAKEADVLLDQIDDAASAFNLQAATIQNSKTAVRQMFNERLGPPSGLLDSLLQGHPVGAAQKLVQGVTGSQEAVRRASGTQAAELARALTQSGPAAQAGLGQLQAARQSIVPRAQNIRSLAERLLRRNTAVTGPAQENLR